MPLKTKCRVPRRINLTLPSIVRSNAYQIYHQNVSGQSPACSKENFVPARKTPYDTGRFLCPHRTRIQSLEQVRHLIGSGLASVHADRPSTPLLRVTGGLSPGWVSSMDFEDGLAPVSQTGFARMKTLQQKKPRESITPFAEAYLRAPQTSSVDDFIGGLRVPVDERIPLRIERLTSNYFPTIGQLRRDNPSPELNSNRLHLHRERRRV